MALNLTVPQIGNSSTTARLNCNIIPMSMLRQDSSLFGSWVAEIVFLFATSIFGTMVNSVCVYTLLKKEQLRTASNVLLISMAASDVLTGILVEPISIARNIYDIKGQDSCNIQDFNTHLGSLSVAISFLNIGMFACDRLLATTCPYWYFGADLYRKYVIGVLAAWFLVLLNVISAYSRLISEKVRSRITTSLFFISALGTLVSYTVIFCKVRSISRAALKVTPLQTRTENSKPKTAHFNKADQHVRIEVESENKMDEERKPDTDDDIKQTGNRVKKLRFKTYTSFLIFGALVICYMPHIIFVNVLRNRKMDIATEYIAKRWVLNIVILNSSVNPVIYCLRVKSIRDQDVKEAIEKLMGVALLAFIMSIIEGLPQPQCLSFIVSNVNNQINFFHFPPQPPQCFERIL
eukprot:gene6822-12415_t